MLQMMARAVDAAFLKAVSQHHSIHGPGAGAGNALNVQRAALQQRIKDAPGEGMKGHLTTKADEIDAVVKRTCQRLYEGNVKHIVDTTKNFFKDYATRIFFCAEEHQTNETDGMMVFESFHRTKKSAAGLDAGQPRELTFLSRSHMRLH